ncbi:MAG: hypothetical protein ABGZ24_13050, partial [Fuerstiella sp.]
HPSAEWQDCRAGGKCSVIGKVNGRGENPDPSEEESRRMVFRRKRLPTLFLPATFMTTHNPI